MKITKLYLHISYVSSSTWITRFSETVKQIKLVFKINFLVLPGEIYNQGLPSPCGWFYRLLLSLKECDSYVVQEKKIHVLLARCIVMEIMRSFVQG